MLVEDISYIITDDPDIINEGIIDLIRSIYDSANDWLDSDWHWAQALKQPSKKRWDTVNRLASVEVQKNMKNMVIGDTKGTLERTIKIRLINERLIKILSRWVKLTNGKDKTPIDLYENVGVILNRNIETLIKVEYKLKEKLHMNLMPSNELIDAINDKFDDAKQAYQTTTNAIKDDDVDPNYFTADAARERLRKKRSKNKNIKHYEVRDQRALRCDNCGTPGERENDVCTICYDGSIKTRNPRVLRAAETQEKYETE